MAVHGYPTAAKLHAVMHRWSKMHFNSKVAGKSLPVCPLYELGGDDSISSGGPWGMAHGLTPVLTLYSMWT